MNLNGKKAKIDYPCQWQYKLIGRFEELIKDDVKKFLKNKGYKIEVSNKSKKGKFISLNLFVTVQNEQERVKIFNQLSNSQVIMQIL